MALFQNVLTSLLSCVEHKKFVLPLTDHGHEQRAGVKFLFIVCRKNVTVNTLIDYIRVTNSFTAINKAEQSKWFFHCSILRSDEEKQTKLGLRW